MRVTVLDTIGRTRLIPLQHIVPEGSARILLKLEYENPTGSMKDRMSLAMVEAAEADGRLRCLHRLDRPYKVEGVDARVDGDVVRLLLVTDADDSAVPAGLFAATIAL